MVGKIKLGEPFYLNIAQTLDGIWWPCWQPEFAGDTTFSKAVEKRKLWLEYLKKWGHPGWSSKHLKTVKIRKVPCL